MGQLLHIFLIHYFLIGAAAGLLSGLLGIGGGLFVVPALAYTFKEIGFPEANVMHMAVGSSFVIMVITSARALLSHMSYSLEFWSIYKRLAPSIIVGAISGAVLAHFLHSHTLSILFGIFVLLVAGELLLFPDLKLSGGLPGPWAMRGVGWLIGAKSGLLGVGGGAITIPFLTYCDISIRRAVIVSAAVSFTVALVGSCVFAFTGASLSTLPDWTLGYVYFPAVLAVALGSVVFAPLGTKLSHWLPIGTLKKIFAVFLILVGIHMFTNL